MLSWFALKKTFWFQLGTSFSASNLVCFWSKYSERFRIWCESTTDPVPCWRIGDSLLVGGLVTLNWMQMLMSVWTLCGNLRNGLWTPRLWTRIKCFLKMNEWRIHALNHQIWRTQTCIQTWVNTVSLGREMPDCKHSLNTNRVSEWILGALLNERGAVECGAWIEWNESAAWLALWLKRVNPSRVSSVQWLVCVMAELGKEALLRFGF